MTGADASSGAIRPVGTKRPANETLTVDRKRAKLNARLVGEGETNRIRNRGLAGRSDDVGARERQSARGGSRERANFSLFTKEVGRERVEGKKKERGNDLERVREKKKKFASAVEGSNGAIACAWSSGAVGGLSGGDGNSRLASSGASPSKASPSGAPPFLSGPSTFPLAAPGTRAPTATASALFTPATSPSAPSTSAPSTSAPSTSAPSTSEPSISGGTSVLSTPKPSDSAPLASNGSSNECKTDEELYRRWKASGAGERGGKKWKTLVHNGVLFAPQYEPHGVSLLYDRKHVSLTPTCEEVANLFAAKLGTEFEKHDIFRRNFFLDFRTILKKAADPAFSTIQKMDRCDFSRIRAHFDAEGKRRMNLSVAEKKAASEAEDERAQAYAFAVVDGREEKVENFHVQPPSLFLGRGKNNPLMGKVRRRLYPEDFVLNIHEGAPVPETLPGHQWGDVVHDNTVIWLCNHYCSAVNKKLYVTLGPENYFRRMNDMQVSEKARMVGEKIESIRRDYRTGWSSKSKKVRQRSVVTYLIDIFKLHAGQEQYDGADASAVGCCTLRVEHLKLIQPQSVEYDFVGNNAVRKHKVIEVENAVFENIRYFMLKKARDDYVFDRVTPLYLNESLKTIMPGLTAHSLRTHNIPAKQQPPVSLSALPALSSPTTLHTEKADIEPQSNEELTGTRLLSTRADVQKSVAGFSGQTGVLYQACLASREPDPGVKTGTQGSRYSSGMKIACTGAQGSALTGGTERVDETDVKKPLNDRPSKAKNERDIRESGEKVVNSCEQDEKDSVEIIDLDSESEADCQSRAPGKLDLDMSSEIIGLDEHEPTAKKVAKREVKDQLALVGMAEVEAKTEVYGVAEGRVMAKPVKAEPVMNAEFMKDGAGSMDAQVEEARRLGTRDDAELAEVAREAESERKNDVAPVSGLPWNAPETVLQHTMTDLKPAVEAPAEVKKETLLAVTAPALQKLEAPRFASCPSLSDTTVPDFAHYTNSSKSKMPKTPALCSIPQVPAVPPVAEPLVSTAPFASPVAFATPTTAVDIQTTTIASAPLPVYPAPPGVPSFTPALLATPPPVNSLLAVSSLTALPSVAARTTASCSAAPCANPFTLPQKRGAPSEDVSSVPASASGFGDRVASSPSLDLTSLRKLKVSAGNEMLGEMGQEDLATYFAAMLTGFSSGNGAKFERTRETLSKALEREGFCSANFLLGDDPVYPGEDFLKFMTEALAAEELVYASTERLLKKFLRDLARESA